MLNLVWKGLIMGKIYMQDMTEKSVAFLTLGCKVNTYETDAMKELFLAAGFVEKDFSDKADVYVINTCTVTNIADRKSRQMLHKAKKHNPDSVVIAVGCYVQAAKEALEIDESIDLVIGNDNKKNIVEILGEYYKDNSNNEAWIDLSKNREYEELSIQNAGEKTRAYIKVQDGCNQFCSYCIIPYTRGRVRSRKLAEVVSEVKKLVQAGYKEVVLTGIHLSSYGIDFEEKLTLLDLIVAVSEVEGLERIRLGSLEPRIITEEFVETLSKNKKFCPHFHLSMQSGCNETLKRMNRRYTSEEFYEKCELIRKWFELPAITTDVIVGFPGETIEEFNTTKEFVQKVAFAQMHVFKYSKRKGTRAEVMENQVDEQEKHARSTALLEVEHKMRKGYQNQFKGRTEYVLIEEEVTIDGVTYQIGHNERYLKLAIVSDHDYTNGIVKVTVKDNITDDLLLCEIIN